MVGVVQVIDELHAIQVLYFHPPLSSHYLLLLPLLLLYRLVYFWPA